MRLLGKYVVLAAVMLAGAVQVASAQAAPAPARPLKVPTLYGTLGACNNAFPGGPCTETSILVELDPATGAVIDIPGPVGYTVNGLAWDRTTKKLYASTAIGDVAFHGLITIDPVTGAGTPVDATVHNFGLPGADSPIHGIAIDPFGNMVAWYDEFPPPDTFVRINKKTGIATEFAGKIDTSQNGLAFQAFGPLSILWNIDVPRKQADGTYKQIAYVLNPLNGNVLVSRTLPVLAPNPDPRPPPVTPRNPPAAALGDFHPVSHLYYGLDFTAFDQGSPTYITVIDPILGKAKAIGPTHPSLHVVAFVKP